MIRRPVTEVRSGDRVHITRDEPIATVVSTVVTEVHGHPAVKLVVQQRRGRHVETFDVYLGPEHSVTVE